MSRSSSSKDRPATSPAVRARAKSPLAVGRVTSSSVRIEMMQATSCSNGDRKPSLASSNSAALGNGRTASATRSITMSISNGCFLVILAGPVSRIFRFSVMIPAMTMQTTKARQADVLARLRSTFGFHSFRPIQGDVVEAILRGQDVFVLLPTGGGKSLCYQLPALLLDGLTVVVSPLIALMKDQVDALEAMGVAATFINSSLDPSEIGRRQGAVARGDVKLLYVAPERLMTAGFLRLLANIPVSLIAIDEAHCISEWGHDFRPEYRELRRVRASFPTAAVAAFTATATRRVQADIIAQLGLSKAACFRGSFNRANLYYDVRPKRGSYDQLIAFLQTRANESGIIYCSSRDSTDTLAAKLTASGYRARSYHAGLDPDERRRRQEAFIKDDTRIIVATIAFGMGIDKPDVRYVVHWDLPKNLEGYYQESGRAGRDGEPSDCILFFSAGDAIKQRRFAQEKLTAAERRVALDQLQQMVDWADGLTCRRKALLAYFDEPFDGQTERCCDVCSRPRELVDSTLPARQFLSAVRRTGERFGVSYVIDVLRGSRAERILANRHDQLPTYGIGRDRSKEDWQHLARELARAGYTRLSADEYKVVSITEPGLRVLFQDEPVELTAPVATGPVAAASANRGAVAAPTVASNDRADLFDRLRVARKKLADERRVPPYVICHDPALRGMVASLPRNRGELLRISGIGEHTADTAGGIFLDVIAAYAREKGITPANNAPLFGSSPPLLIPEQKSSPWVAATPSAGRPNAILRLIASTAPPPRKSGRLNSRMTSSAKEPRPAIGGTRKSVDGNLTATVQVTLDLLEAGK